MISTSYVFSEFANEDIHISFCRDGRIHVSEEKTMIDLLTS